jgi:hypothetical protein
MHWPTKRSRIRFDRFLQQCLNTPRSSGSFLKTHCDRCRKWICIRRSFVRETQERLDGISVMKNEFLWEEERKLAAAVLLVNERAIAWCEEEKGRFRDDYFSPVIFPVIEHIPWCKKNRPTPPAVREKMADLVRKKVAAGVYEPSQSSYRHAIKTRTSNPMFVT